jgi:hypothetical protein
MVSGGLLVLAGTALATFEDLWRARRGTSAPEAAAQEQGHIE